MTYLLQTPKSVQTSGGGRMSTNELLKDIYRKFDTGEYVKIPSMRKIGESKWVVYFYENGLIHNGVYYTEERARRKLEQVNGG